jgi:epoxyqueuosine reductase
MHADAIIQQARDMGFALAGVCDAKPSAYREAYDAWIAAQKHGEMQYLARNVDLRIDPAALVPGAQSIICVADRYWSHAQEAIEQNDSDQPIGRIARYARGDDYHTVMKKRLHALCDRLAEQFPDEMFRTCVDTAPVLEREHAQRAGLGAIGKHTLLIDRGEGSHLLLGEIITTLNLDATAPADADPCGSCTHCIDACPTDAITPWSVDATKCISYLTIEHRSEIDPQHHEAIGDWLFGCDICQEVCPHNRSTGREDKQTIHPAYTPRLTHFNLLDVMNWTEDDRRAALTRSAMKRATLAMFQRNALINAGNALLQQENADVRNRIHAMAGDASIDPMVRDTAGATFRRIDG